MKFLTIYKNSESSFGLSFACNSINNFKWRNGRYTETNKNKAKEQKGGFLPKLLGTLAASILGNALSGIRVIRAGQGVIRAGQTF